VKCKFEFGVGHDASMWPALRSEDKRRKVLCQSQHISSLKLTKY